MSLLFRRVRWADATRSGEDDVLVEGDRIARIGRDLGTRADETVDGAGRALVPGLVNAHAHSAMTLLRGYADDLDLMEWLQKKIWPVERNLAVDHVAAGVRLAIVEMLRSGTTAFNDMYFLPEGTCRAARDLGIRATVASVFFNAFEKKTTEQARREVEAGLDLCADTPGVRPAVGAHSAYTVDLEGLAECARISERRGVVQHFHLAETQAEMSDYRAKHGRGLLEALDSIGFLTPRLVAAHAIWLDPAEIRLLAARGASVVHCPASNLKLASGRASSEPPRVFDFRAMRDAGVNVALGTDGPASNNNLDLFEAMKTAALLQKHHWGDPTRMTAREAFALGTANGAKALGLDAGRIAEGALADLAVIDLSHPRMVPGHDLVADLVYAGGGPAVESVLVGGRFAMRDRRIPGEARILDEARAAAKDLVSRA